MNRNIQELFDRLKDGLLLISEGGTVLYANPAAQVILQITETTSMSFEWLNSQIIGVQSGYLTLPLSFTVDLRHETGLFDSVQVTLLASPARNTVMALLKDTSADRLYANELNNVSEMLYVEMCVPIKKLLAALADMLDEVKIHSRSNLSLLEKASIFSSCSDSVMGRLQEILLLAETSRMSPIYGEERILLSKLIEEAIQASRTVLTKHAIRFSYCGLNDRLPVIYGSEFFLTQALAGYLKHFAEQTEHGSHFVISTKITGNIILLSIAKSDAPAPITSTINSAPFFYRKNTKGGGNQLTLVLCKRVLRLNGGNIRFQREGGETKAIIFEFPIGAPPTTNANLDLQQTLRYAQDLSALLQVVPEDFWVKGVSTS